MHAGQALEEAFVRYGQPGMVNTDQRARFAAEGFSEAVLGLRIRLSTNGRGR